MRRETYESAADKTMAQIEVLTDEFNRNMALRAWEIQRAMWNFKPYEVAEAVKFWWEFFKGTLGYARNHFRAWLRLYRRAWKFTNRAEECEDE